MSETPEMVERVAREPEMVRRVAEAMFEGYRRFINATLGPDMAPIPWAELDGTSMRCYCATARAGIEAMREPSEAITKAWDGIQVLSSEGDWNEWLDVYTASRVWAAGIDAALAAPEEGREP